MANPTSGGSGDSTSNLFGEWTLADEPGSSRADDSLLAFTSEPAHEVPPPRHEKPRLARTFPPPGFDPGAGLADNFSFGDEGAPDDDLSLRSPGPRSPTGNHPARPASVAMPRLGAELGGFRLVGELGRGAFARVYLARQENLGQRLVALKVSRAEGDEPQILARLQHSHIVPVYSVQDDPTTGLRLLCMPYLGGANLAQVLEAAGATLPAEATGKSLIAALDVVSNRMQSATGLDQSAFTVDDPRPTRRSLTSRSYPGAPGDRPGPIEAGPSLWTRLSGRIGATPDEVPADEPEMAQPARQFLRAANSIQAAVWIVARLAEGLDHAHSRGLLHRDLKPSNILIAGDGTPMLLDFNLATSSAPHDPAEGTKALLGGTLPYMAPEHLDAFHPQGTTPPEAVCEQADLYALGLILFELIAGSHPFPEPSPNQSLLETIRFMIAQRGQVPSLRAACREVPWSLDALVSKCLDPDPTRRHARARDLAEDLRRYLDDLPFKHTPEPSLRERFGKWARRNPRACSSTSIALVSTVLLLGLGGVIGLLSGNLQHVAARLKLSTFQSGFDECQFLLHTSSGPTGNLSQGIALAAETLELQGIGGTEGRRNGSWVRWLEPDERSRLREQSAELILLLARARVHLAGRVGSEADRAKALDWAVAWLDRAERLDPRPSHALFSDRARYRAALGQSDRAEEDRRRADRTPPVTGRDFELLGTTFLASGKPDRAEVALNRAVTLEPRRFWARFALGICHEQLGRHLEAAGDFDACTVLMPDFPWPHANRGEALAGAGRLIEARASYDRALTLKPRFVEALINRARVCLELDDLAGAERDLKRAVALGRRDTAVMAALGEVLARRGKGPEAERLYARLLADEPDRPTLLVARGIFRLGSDPAGARADLARALAIDPHHARAHLGMAQLDRQGDLAAALGHVEAALKAEPDFLDALQLRALIRARLGDRGALDDVDRLIQAPTAHRLYNASCALAILSASGHDPRLAARAVTLLGRALDAGFRPAEAAADPDLKPLRDRPDFRALMPKATAVQHPRP